MPFSAIIFKNSETVRKRETMEIGVPPSMTDEQFQAYLNLSKNCHFLVLLRDCERERRPITFVGFYWQRDCLKESGIEAPVPFVIVQTPEQQSIQGRLEGMIFEPGDQAKIEGIIDDGKVEFEKRYHPRKPDAKGQVKVCNDFPIHYTGESKDGISYKGSWSFNPAQKFDLETAGRFLIDRMNVERLSLVKRTLQENLPVCSTMCEYVTPAVTN